MKWTYSEVLHGKREDITDISHTYRHCLLDSTADLPNGWSRHLDKNGKNHYFRNQCDLSQKFGYPIPMPQDQQPEMPPISACYIHGETRGATLLMGKMFANTASNCLAVALVDYDGK